MEDGKGVATTGCCFNYWLLWSLYEIIISTKSKDHLASQ